MSQCIAQLLQEAIRQGMARIDAQMLMLHACGQNSANRAWLIAHDRDAPSPEQLQRWRSFIARRQRSEPVAYIIGYKEFYGLRLNVNQHVLDPRDDTETLVDWALDLIPTDRPFKVLDLGTGSGAIALAIKSQRPLAQVTATDASAEALQVAHGNAQALNLHVRFIQADAMQSNWFGALDNEKFELIVSNPPYIAEGDKHLSALTHEPALALTSGADGLDAIRSITQHAPEHLEASGWLLIEHGFDQAGDVQRLMKNLGFENVHSRRDLSANMRCTGGYANP